MRSIFLGFAMLIGCTCESAEAPAARAPATTPTTVPTPHAAPVEAPAAPAPGEAEARAAAEAFVRAQGYADTPPTVSGDAIVHEGIEGTIEDRLNSLDPHAVSVGRIGSGWGATFRYMDPQYAGRGRSLIMPEGETPHFVHQDRLLSPSP